MAKRAVLSSPTAFRCLNKTYEFPTAADWDRPDQLFLWKYNLHYFDYLNPAGPVESLDWARQAMGRWIREHRAGLGWDPYPTSLRICNWIRTHLEGRPLPPAAVTSLAQQADLLARSVEYHIGANHLFANAKALVFAGDFFKGDDAARWYRRGLRILEQELPVQFLSDGGHYERSPMYHAILLEDLLDLANLFASRPAAEAEPAAAMVRAAIAQGLAWLRTMTVPGGAFPLFGDSSRAIAPELVDLEAYAERLGFLMPLVAAGNIYLQPSGFLRLQLTRQAVLFATVDGPKPGHQPGHAHADTFACELYLDGRPVLVDAGVPTYERGDERLRSRGTAMHNTLQIGAADSSEVWSSFRVGRRARVSGVRWLHDGNEAVFSASHDGYRWLPGRPLHHREWRLMPQGLRITDSLSTSRPCDCTVRFRAAPGLTWSSAGAAGWALRDGGDEILTIRGQKGFDYRVVSDSYFPEFNRPLPIQVLEARGTLADRDACVHELEVCGAHGAQGGTVHSREQATCDS